MKIYRKWNKKMMTKSRDEDIKNSMLENFGKSNSVVKMAFMAVLALIMVLGAIGGAEAAITTVPGNAWSQIYTNTNAFPGTIAYTVNAGSNTNRLLVVAVSSSIDAAGAKTCSVTYGGQSMTQVTADGGSTQAHTYLFRLSEAGLDAAANTNLIFTWGGAGSASVNNVFATVYDGVDQSANPIGSSVSGTGTTSVALPSNLTIAAGEQAVEVVNMSRTGGTTYRTITTPATNWTSVLGPLSTNDGTVYNSSYILTDATAGTTNANHTISSATASIYAMSAMSIKASQATTAGTATAVAASGTTINVSMPYTDDGNANNTYTVDYKLSLSGTWTNWVTNAAHTTSPYTTTITGLSAGTSYDVRVTYNDTDGVNGSATQTISNIFTWNTLTVGDATNPANKTVYRSEADKAVSAFTLSVDAGTATVSQIVVTGTASAGSSQTETSAAKIYQDNNGDREWDAGDTLIASTTFATNTATFSGLSISVTTTTVNYIIAYDISATATSGRTLQAQVSGITSTANTNTDNDTNDATLTIGTQTLTAGDGTDPAAKNVYRTDTNKALDTFTLSLNAGNTTVTQIVVTSTTSLGSGQTETSAVKIWQDTGTTANEWDAGDTLIASTTFATNTATFSGLSIPVTTATDTYIVTVDISATATATRTITAQLSGISSSAQTNTDNDTGGATLTITSQTLTVGDATNPTNKTVYRSEADKAISAFTLSVDAGTATVSQIVVTGTASAGSSQTETSAAKIYQDNNGDREWDAGDTLIASTTFATNTATFSGLSISVTTTTVNYIIAYDISATATSGRTLQAQVSGITSTANTNTDSDNNDATLTIGTQTLTVGNGTNPANANAPRSSTNNALDGFTLSLNGGSGTVSTLTVTGSANFTATNIPTNGVKIYRDAGTIGTLDGTDTLISSGSTAIAGNATTVTLASAETVTTTSANYLVTVDITAGATLSQTFTGNISAATGSGIGTPVDNDTTSATLTITAAQTLTIGNGTNPASANALRSSTNNALDGFTLSLNTGSGTVSTLTVTGSANFNATNIPTNGVKIYRDAGTIGTLDGTDTLISSGSTAIAGNATTVTLASAETVTTTSANYLVTVDITAGATLSQTFTGNISAATGSGIGTPVDNDTTSATLTIIASLSTITSCAGCHDYPPLDGTRSGVTGAFVGDHQVHTYICSTCHVIPATETSADFAHRNANIQMKAGATAIDNGYYDKNGNSAYNAGVDDTFAQTNSPVTASCRTVSCHGGVTTPQWGVGTTTCSDCHAGVVKSVRRTTTGASSDFSKEGTGSTHVAAGINTPLKATCQACHGSHLGLGLDPNASLLNADSGAAITFDGTAASTEVFCISCHDSNGATRLGTPTDPFGTDGANVVNIGWTIGTVAHSQASNVNKCMACHGDASGTGTTLSPTINAHGSSSKKLTRYSYTAGAEQTFCYNCHGTTVANGAQDSIQPMFAKTYPHAVADCAACHNKHIATIASPLSGMSGADPSTPGAGAQPTFSTVTVTDPDHQYKVCFNCHSNFSAGATKKVDIDFNTANDSFHWVEKDKYSYTVNTGTSKGIWTIATFNLNAVPTQGTKKYVEVMMPRSGFTYNDANLRTLALRCSDCHGPNAADGGVAVPEGPHGSSVAKILKVPAGSPYTTWNATTSSLTGNTWCLNCHNPSFTNSGFRPSDGHLYGGSGKHQRACQYCHIPIPHGSGSEGTGVANQRRHLLKTTTFTEGIDSETSGSQSQHGSWVIPGCT